MKTSSQTLFNNIIKIESESANKIKFAERVIFVIVHIFINLNDYLKHFLNKPKF